MAQIGFWTLTDTGTQVPGPGGQIQTGRLFNGSSDYFVIPPVSLPGVLSVSGWFLRNAINNLFVMLGSNTTATAIRDLSNTQLYVTIGTTSGTFDVPPMEKGIWHHLVLVRDESNLCRLWLDGDERTAATLPGTFQVNQIGRRGSNRYHSGALAWIRIFDSDESANVAALRAEGTGIIEPPDPPDVPTVRHRYRQVAGV